MRTFFRLPYFHTQRGSAILEVLIATTVMTMIVTGIAVAMSMSINTASESQFKEVAVGQARELIEVLRKERKFLGWPAFFSQVSAGTYCVNSQEVLLSEVLADSTSCSSFGLTVGSTPFKRELTLSKDLINDSVTATVEMTWQSGARETSEQVSQTFYKWDD